MAALGVVELEVLGQATTQFRSGLVGLEVDVLVLHAAPQPLDENIVEPPPLTVHADLNARSL